MGLFSRKQKDRQKPEEWVTPEERAARGLEEAIFSGISSGEGDDEIVLVAENLKRKAKPEENANSVAPPVAIPPEPERKKLRVLLISTDTALFSSGSAAEAEYAALSDYLDELHVIVVTFRKKASFRSRRIAPNVWIYPTESRSPLFALWDIYRIARKQMAFASGFRADVIVATDPFETGTAAYAIAKRYSRPLQLQVLVNPFEKDYVSEHAGNKWRLFAAKFLIPRADCLFVRSEYIRDVLKEWYSEAAAHLTVLPPFYNLASFKDAVPHFDLHERYPQMKFIILVVSSLDARGQADFAINTCTPIMRQYPTIGMVIVGDGPLRRQLERKVAAAGLQNQVVFESETGELVSYMKSSNLFLNASTDEDHDMYLAAAAAAGLPVLTVTGSIASTLFEDNVNAFVCPENDMVCLQARIGEFLNDNQLRSSFSINARSQVFDTMEQDPEAYRRAFIESFESCLLKTYVEEA